MWKTLTVVMVALVIAGSAGAATITYSDANVLATTNWSKTVSVPKFNTALGTLNSITFTLGGHVEGSAKFESLDAAPAEIFMDLSAKLKLNRPSGTLIVQTIPVVSTDDLVTAYDGTTDYAGTSGKSYTGLSADDSNTTVLTSVADKALFTGAGNIVLPNIATGASTGSGAGNLQLLFNTSASAQVQVVYDYTVPEPATMSLLALGGLAVLKRRRN